VIVAVQNDGGRIFEHLPIARSPAAALLDRCFTMPQRLDFAPAAAMFGLAYARVADGEALAAALAAAHGRAGATLIEALVPPGDGAARAARLHAEVRRRLGALPLDSGPAADAAGPAKGKGP
jgi:2-succinyl-5-enolpyruvyl-6-hydroxy-3-cyclohexene-1-carboxylate synthase